MDFTTVVVVIVVVLGLLASVVGTVALVKSQWLGSKLIGSLGIISIVAYTALMLGTSSLAELDAKKTAEAAASAATTTS